MTNQSPATLLGNAINRYLSLDPELLDKLAPLHGKIFMIVITGFNTNLYLMPCAEGVEIQTSLNGEPDVTIKGTAAALLMMLKKDDATTSLLSGDIEMKGNIRLARQFNSIMADINIDWEEHLSTFIGDFAASKLTSVFTSTKDWCEKSLNSVANDISEYFQEESRDIVSGYELEAFNDDVDMLRDKTEKLRNKIDQLFTGKTS